MADDIKWDSAKLTSLLRKLKEQRDIISQNRELLMNINKEAEAAWQGYAGRAFDQRMDIDADNLETFISLMDKLINDLEGAVSECYEACENDIDGMLGRLRNLI